MSTKEAGGAKYVGIPGLGGRRPGMSGNRNGFAPARAGIGCAMVDPSSVGVIGVGSIGEHFVEWLVEADRPVYAHDIDPNRQMVASERGAESTAHAADLTDRSDVIVLSLPGSPYVERVMEGPDGVLDSLGNGQLVLDTGTSRVKTDIHYQRECEARGTDLLDAPLTWGGPGERPTMFVGGDPGAYERARPVIERLSSQHRRFGEVGMGQVVKASHRLRQNNRAMVDAEMVEFLRNHGVDPRAVDDLLELGIHTRMFEETYPTTAGWERAVDTEAPPGPPEGAVSSALATGAGRTRIDGSQWAKDQAYAVELGHATNTALPISTAVYHAMLMAENYASALFDRDLGFQDPDWYDRADPVSHFRRLNRPAEQWRRVNSQRKDAD